MGILIIAEHDNAALKTSTLNTICAATRLEGEITLLVAGKDCAAVAETASRLDSVSNVLMAEDDRYERQLAENLALLVIDIADGYSYILAPATTFGKDLLPRVAALLGVAQISDIVAIESTDTFVRPIYAGNVMATVRSSDPVKVITVRTSAFDPVSPAEGEAATIRSLPPPAESLMVSRFVRHESSDSDRPELASADIVIAGGRGLRNKDEYESMEQIADRLGAAVGATRAIVDAGLAPNDLQIGQTGKVVAPQLYIAMGISGAIQHLAGMRDSKVIVAINKDEDAPIFQVADYGLVADLSQVLPELTAELDKLDA